MDWSQVITIIAAIGGFTYFLFTKLDSDIKTLSSRMDARTEAQSARIDQLYQMFVDLLKERKG